jgi:hypothetical protein
MKCKQARMHAGGIPYSLSLFYPLLVAAQPSGDCTCNFCAAGRRASERGKVKERRNQRECPVAVADTSLEMEPIALLACHAHAPYPSSCRFRSPSATTAKNPKPVCVLPASHACGSLQLQPWVSFCFFHYQQTATSVYIVKNNCTSYFTNESIFSIFN